MKYVIEVRRGRTAVNQGYAVVCVNGIEMVVFKDQIERICSGDRYYGDLIEGKASRIPDEEFIKSMLFRPSDLRGDYSIGFRLMLDNAIRKQDSKKL